MRSDVLAYIGLEIAQAVIAFLAAAAHFRFHRQNPRQFLGLWGWSWVALGLTRGFGALGVSLAVPGTLAPPGALLAALVQVTSYLALASLGAGSWSLLSGRTVAPTRLAALFGLAGLIGIGPVLAPVAPATRFTLLFTVRPAAAAVVTAAAGAWIWWRYHRSAILGARATGVSIAMFALPLAGYAIATARGQGFDPALTIDGVVLAGIGHAVVSAAMALSMIGWLVELERQRGLAAESELQRQLAARERRLALAERMESVGRLAGGVAHDFNNLLTVVKGNTTLLAGLLPVDSPGREWLAEIRQASDRGAGLVRQLLAFARRQPVEPRAFDLGELIASLEGIIRRLLGETIAFQFRRAAAPCWVRADPSRIEQVIMNLAANAKDAMPDGGRFEVELGEAFDPVAGRHSIRLTLADTGVGMSDEVQARAFEPFFSTKPAGFGTGLGLATAYGVIEQAGGQISVESRVGGGTTFAVTLPAAGPPPAVASAPAPSGSTAGSEWVLIVEDEAGVRRVASRTLAGHGYSVIEAADGVEALEALGRHPSVSCIVSDVVMPRLGGNHFAQSLRERFPAIPVVFTSGYTGDFSPPASALTSFLQKPYTPDDLAATVRRSIDRARPRDHR